MSSPAANPHKTCPIDSPIEYEIAGRSEPWASGRASAGRVSGKCITFKPQHPIPPGLCIELRLDWPARLDDAIAIKLHATGVTAEIENGTAVVNVTKHEFRAVNRSRPSALRVAAG